MSKLQAALEKFRNQAVASSKVLDAGRKEREDKLAKKPSAKRPAASRAKAKPSAASAASQDAAPAQPSNWKALPAQQELEPLGLRQMKVIEYLLKAEAPQTPVQILRGTGRNLEAETDLAEALQSHPRVLYSPATQTYEYQSRCSVKDRAGLLRFLQASPEPLAFSEVADAYGSVKADIEALRSEGLLLVLHSYEKDEDILYAVDPRLAGLPRLDADVAALWAEKGGDLPEDDESMAAELKKIGLQPAPRKAPRLRTAGERKKKARRKPQLRHVTNVHLMHLFEGDAPTQID